MAPNKSLTENGLEAAILKLVAYCQANDWAGYDPYDALNSRAFAAMPFLNFKFPRLALTQALKRSPINIRPLLLIPKTQNPKAIGLFLSAFLKLSKFELVDQGSLVESMIERLIALRSRDIPYWCWGYSFPWQMRTGVVPEGAPNLVCTSFVANALLDAYEVAGDQTCLTMAISAAEFIATKLYWSEGISSVGFAYPLPSFRSQVHNANFLGAALVCRAAKHAGDPKFLERALNVARHSVAQQRVDGSWLYGEMPSQQWIDNFHTGYNLCALRTIARYAETSEFEEPLRRGLEFYRANFFGPEGEPKYFHDRTYPIDIHCVAQSIITLVELADLDAGNVRLAHLVLEWAMRHMWDERGFFYYRVLSLLTIRTSYMRWSQAWMFFALSTFLSHRRSAAVCPPSQDVGALVPSEMDVVSHRH